MSHSSRCLNCNENTSGKFCSNCGQKTDTHRITFKHFVFHDILHGTLHMEKGILFTLKQALIRPGKASLDYISGKRIRYYNVFYLALLLIGLNILLIHYYDVLFEYYFSDAVARNNSNETGKKIGTFMETNAKMIILSFLPFLAVNSFLLFRRKRLNLSEHTIISGMIFAGVLTLVLFGNAFLFFDFTKHFTFIGTFFNWAVPFMILSYIIYSYYNAFGSDYSAFGFLARILLLLSLLIIEFLILIILLWGYITKWTFSELIYQ